MSVTLPESFSFPRMTEECFLVWSRFFFCCCSCRGGVSVLQLLLMLLLEKEYPSPFLFSSVPKLRLEVSEVAQSKLSVKFDRLHWARGRCSMFYWVSDQRFLFIIQLLIVISHEEVESCRQTWMDGLSGEKRSDGYELEENERIDWRMLRSKIHEEVRRYKKN